MALAGLTVVAAGPAEPLPGSADLTAYRIIQEGLANVARHSAADTAFALIYLFEQRMAQWIDLTSED